MFAANASVSIPDVERQAYHLVDAKPDPDILELDAGLWNLFATLCRRPDSEWVRDHLAISSTGAEALARATPSQIEGLASGVVLGFRLADPAIAERALEMLAEPASGADRGNLFFEDFGPGHKFWSTLQRASQRSPALAALAFGVNAELAEAMATATDNQVRSLARGVDPVLTIRGIDEPLLLRLLSRQSSPAQRAMAMVERYQRALNENLGIEVVDTGEISAREMALMGLVTRIIILETGLTDKQLRRVYADLERDGYQFRRRRASRTIRSSVSLQRSHRTKLQASLLMSIYKALGGKPIYKGVRIEALRLAFRMYRAILSEIGQVEPVAPDEALTISCGWSLASEIRAEDAYFEVCYSLNCDGKTEYFISVHQAVNLLCPYCYVPTRDNRKAPELEYA